jgi:hypothetical protein
VKKIIFLIFCFLVFITPLLFFHKTSEVFEFNKIIFVYLCSLCISVAWTIECIVAKKILFRRSALDIPLVLWLLSQLLSTVFSIDPRTSLFGYYSRFYGGFLSSLAFSLLYWAFVSHANRSFVRTVLIFLLSSSALVSLWAIFEHFGHSASCFLITGQFTDSCWVQDVQERVFATLGQPNWLAAYVVALLPLSWAFGLHSTTKKLVEKSFILPVILSGLLYSTLLFTKSRSGFVAFVFAFLVFWFGTFFSTFFRNRLFFIKSISSILVIISLSFVFGTPWTPSFSQLFEKTPPLSESVSEVQVPVLERGGTESGVIRQIVWQGTQDT